MRPGKMTMRFVNGELTDTVMRVAHWVGVGWCFVPESRASKPVLSAAEGAGASAFFSRTLKRKTEPWKRSGSEPNGSLSLVVFRRGWRELAIQEKAWILAGRPEIVNFTTDGRMGRCGSGDNETLIAPVRLGFYGDPPWRLAR